MIFDDQSKSPTFKKLNNIEIPLSEWPYTGEGFKTLELESITEKLQKSVTKRVRKELQKVIFKSKKYFQTLLIKKKFQPFVFVILK